MTIERISIVQEVKSNNICQLNIPQDIRKQLNLNKGDNVRWVLKDNKQLMLSKIE